MDHPKESYIEVLRNELKELYELRKVAEADALTANTRLKILVNRINFHEQAVRELEEGPKPEVPPGEYARLELPEAIEACLERMGGDWVNIKDDVVPPLEAGGALNDTEKKARWRIVKMTITKNPRRFEVKDEDEKEPEKTMVRLKKK